MEPNEVKFVTAVTQLCGTLDLVGSKVILVDFGMRAFCVVQMVSHMEAKVPNLYSCKLNLIFFKPLLNFYSNGPHKITVLDF